MVDVDKVHKGRQHNKVFFHYPSRQKTFFPPFLDAIASPSTYPCQSVAVGEWVIVSDLHLRALRACKLVYYDDEDDGDGDGAGDDDDGDGAGGDDGDDDVHLEGEAGVDLLELAFARILDVEFDLLPS